MILGMAIRPVMLVVLGAVTLLALVFQMLVGYRKIHFKGKKHLLIHKRGAWVLLAIASIHGLLSFVYIMGLSIG